MTKHLLSLILAGLTLASCSQLQDPPSSSALPFQPLPITERTRCESSDKGLAIIGKHRPIQADYTRFLHKQGIEGHHFTLIEKFVLWALIQMNERPDMSSPTARMQLIVHHNNDVRYWDVNVSSTLSKSNAIATPYLHALSALLTAYPSRYTLDELGTFIDRSFDGHWSVDDDFALLLNDHASAIRSVPAFEEAYFKNADPLRPGEKLPPVSMKAILAPYLHPTHKVNYTITNELHTYFPVEGQLSPMARCNFDVKSYENSVYIIDKEILRSNAFGLQDDSGYVLAVSSQDIFPPKSYAGTLLWAGTPTPRVAGVCIYQTQNPKTKAPIELSFLSTQCRDPGQHMHHLFSYGLRSVASIADLDAAIQMPRYLFLTHPLRLVYESNRGNEAQLQRLLQFKFPIYHASSLGHVWGHFQSPTSRGFVADDRHPAYLTCESPESAPASTSKKKGPP